MPTGGRRRWCCPAEPPDPNNNGMLVPMPMPMPMPMPTLGFIPSINKLWWWPMLSANPGMENKCPAAPGSRTFAMPLVVVVVVVVVVVRCLIRLFFRHPPPTGTLRSEPPWVQYLRQFLQKCRGCVRL